MNRLSLHSVKVLIWALLVLHDSDKRNKRHLNLIKTGPSCFIKLCLAWDSWHGEQNDFNCQLFTTAAALNHFTGFVTLSAWFLLRSPNLFIYLRANPPAFWDTDTPLWPVVTRVPVCLHRLTDGLTLPLTWAYLSHNSCITCFGQFPTLSCRMVSCVPHLV